MKKQAASVIAGIAGGQNRRHGLQNPIVQEELVARGSVCFVCGEPFTEDDPAQWHHRDPELKLLPIALAASQHWAAPRLRAELKKCDPMHESCHDRLEKTKVVEWSEPRPVLWIGQTGPQRPWIVFKNREDAAYVLEMGGRILAYSLEEA